MSGESIVAGRTIMHVHYDDDQGLISLLTGAPTSIGIRNAR